MADAKTRKVLVVEDNELNMRLFCDLLGAYGFTTFQCRDGAKAVEIARKELPESFDLLVWIRDTTPTDSLR